MTNYKDFALLYDKILEEIPHKSSLVEVGCGKSTAYMASQIRNNYCHKNLTFYVIDTFQDMHNANVLNYIIPIVDCSFHASLNFRRESLFFVYLNTQPTYYNISSDIDLWLSKIQIGGYIGGNNYSVEGVQQTVNEHFVNIENIYNSWLYKKSERLSMGSPIIKGNKGANK